MSTDTPTLSITDAAAYLGTNRWTLKKAIDHGTVPSIQIVANGLRRVPTAWVCTQLCCDTLPTLPTTNQETTTT